MENLNKAIVILLVLAGLVGMIVDLSSVFPSFSSFYTTAIELYLFIFSAFLVLKRILFYRWKQQSEVVQIKEKSDRYNSLLFQGIILGLFYAVYLKVYSDWLSFDSVMIGILLLYYIGQILANSNPAIYVDANAFSFDDYFLQQWKWRDMKNISIGKEKLIVTGNEKNFELDLNSIDQIDDLRLDQEIDASVLDGDFAAENSSTQLIAHIQSYASHYGVNFQTSA